jgi:putative transcriptional regulator
VAILRRMTESGSLAGKFLLAMPGMGDPRFHRAAIAMMVHDDEGALGIGIGKVREGLGLHALLEDLDIDPGEAPDCAVLDGGPVEPQRGFVLHSPDWQGGGTILAGSLCAMTGSLEVLRAIAEGRGPRRFLIALGYAGWTGGQIEGELQRHGWQVLGGSEAVLFGTPTEERWDACWRSAGIDPALLAGVTGRA